MKRLLSALIINLLLIVVCLLLAPVSPAISCVQSGSGERDDGRKALPAGVKHRHTVKRDTPPNRGVKSRVAASKAIFNSESLSMKDKLPEQLRQLNRTDLGTDNEYDVSTDDGAIGVMRADYGRHVRIFISKFKDTAGPNRSMQTFIKSVDAALTENTSGYYFKKQEPVLDDAGQQVGKLVLLWETPPQESEFTNHEYLMISRGIYLCRIYTDDERFGEALEILKFIRLE